MDLPFETRKNRRLIVTADDFGAAECIDNAILSAIATGQITTVSALTNYPRAAEAVARLQERFPAIGIGVHLNITSGPSLTGADRLKNILTPRGSFLGLARLMDRLGSIDPSALKAELRGQIERLIAAGVTPDHLSSHHNILAIYPPFQDIMIGLAREFRLPVRTPLAISQTHTKRFGYAMTRRRAAWSIIGFVARKPHRALRILPKTYFRLHRSKRYLAESGVAAPDHLIDSLYGKPTVHNVRHILGHLPRGISELVVHLGQCATAAELPWGIETEILTERTIERNLILNGTLRNMMVRERISPAKYGDLTLPG